MYATIRHYRVRPDGSPTVPIEEATRQVQEQFLPQIREVPGFVAYYVVNAGPQELTTVSVFETQDGAEEALRRARQWIKQNAVMARLLPDPPQITAGEVTLHSGR